MQIEYNNPIQPTSQEDYKNKPTNDENSDEAFEDNLYKSSRAAFIRKVYSIVCVQLIVTAIITGAAILFPSFLAFQTKYWGLFIANFIVMLIIEIAIMCCPAGRKHPTNLILLGIFTLCQSYVVSFICSIYALQYGEWIIAQAVILTAILVGGLTIFAFLTKTDFTIYMGLMFVASLCIFMLFFMVIATNNQFLEDLYMMLGVFVFGAYIVIDTQLIAGGKRYQLSLDEHVVGALFLYIDIIALFLRILYFLSRFQNRR